MPRHDRLFVQAGAGTDHLGDGRVATFFARLDQSRARVLNHPGHSSQKSHGRKGAGGTEGVRESLAAADTVEAVAGVAASELTTALGHAVSVDFAGMDVDVARETAEGLIRGAERFPNARLARVDTFGGAQPTPSEWDGARAVTTFGRYSGADDTISFDVSQSGPVARAGLRLEESTGHTVAGTPMGVALHEFGHVVSGHDSAAGSAAATVSQEAKISRTTSHDLVAAGISRYAASSPHELTAEAFADVMTRGDSASPLSRKIFDEIQADYDRNGAQR